MRPKGLAQPQSCRNICLFCASSLNRNAISPSVFQARTQRRYLNSTRNASQSAAAAVAVVSEPPPPALGPGHDGSWSDGPTFARPTQRMTLNDAELQARQQMLARQEELRIQMRTEQEAREAFERQRRGRRRPLIIRSPSGAEKPLIRNYQVDPSSTAQYKVRFLPSNNLSSKSPDSSTSREAVPTTWRHIQPRKAEVASASSANRAVDVQPSAPAQNDESKSARVSRPSVGRFIRLVKSVDPSKDPCPRCGTLGHFASECPSMGGPVRKHQFQNPEPQMRRSPIRVFDRDDKMSQLDRAAGRVASDGRGGFGNRSQTTERDGSTSEQIQQPSPTFWRPVQFKTGAESLDDSRTAPLLGLDGEPRPSTVGKKSEPQEDDSTSSSSRRVRRASRYDEEDADDAEFQGKSRSRRSRSHEEEDEEGFQSHRTSKAAKKAKKQQRKEQRREQNQYTRAPQSDLVPIHLPDFISVSNLASALNVRANDFVRKMEELGYEDVGHDHILNAENAGLVAMEYGFEPIAADEAKDDEDLHPAPPPEDPSVLPSRPPVVTIMGHVDHGKTTLLDFIRKSSVADGEFGGITQHIGAFSVPLASGKSITFLDTPGHSAFESMRKRGADVTDIVVLVVAADDSVKPQTIEAIKHAQAAGVPMIVAISKMDKEGAGPEQVKRHLARHGVTVEEFGGETQVVEVSGKTGKGMQELEDAIALLSEVLDQRAEVDGPVEGWILEATTKKAGRVATVLVKRGTLRPGDMIVAGTAWARIRSLRNEAGTMIKEAGPGMPVEVDGWRDQAEAGDMVLQAPNEQKASEVVAYRQDKKQGIKLAKDMEALNESRRLEQKRQADAAALAGYANFMSETAEQEPAPATNSAPSKQTIPFIIKADVSGSVEAVNNALYSLGNDLISMQILRSGVGAISEFDIDHASAASGHIASFNLPVDPRIRQMAEHTGVTIVEDNVIYRLSDKVSALLEAKLPTTTVQHVVGEAEIAMRFSIGAGGKKKVDIAGCKVRNGVVARNARVRVLRAGEKIYDGSVSSLKNVKKDVDEMRKGSECGLGFEEWQGFEVGDLIQCYEEKVERRTL